MGFSIFNEDWIGYRIEDGTVLRSRLVVGDIYRTIQISNTGYPEIQYLTQNLISVIVPDKLRGVPSAQPIDMQNDVPEELSFDEIEIKNQEYNTSDGFKVIIKPVLQKVFKYDKLNMFGEPGYQVNLQSISNIEKIKNAK
jgi:hypothetical protein